MRLHDVLEELQRQSDDKNKEGATAAEIITSVKATREVTVFISLPGNEVITDKESGDEETYICVIYLVIR